MMAGPVVSVVMPVWNPDIRYFTRAVRSILDQTLTDFELIIVEDPGSPTIDKVAASLNDSRVRVLKQRDRGRVGRALNVGIAAARAELIARMDADDESRPDRLALQSSFLQDHPDVTVHGSRITVIDEEERVIGHRRLPLSHDAIAAALRRYNCISHPSVMFRKTAVAACGGYDEFAPAEDYDLWCRLLLSGARFQNSEEELIRYRFHAGAAKQRAVHEEIRTTVAIKKRYFARSFNMGDRARLAAETALLALPAPLIVRLFRLLEYRQ